MCLIVNEEVRMTGAMSRVMRVRSLGLNVKRIAPTLLYEAETCMNVQRRKMR